jgi:hypothetical protein
MQAKWFGTLVAFSQLLINARKSTLMVSAFGDRHNQRHDVGSTFIKGLQGVR